VLVQFTKGFILEGENTFTKRERPWSKPQDIRHKIYLRTFVSGICDEAEVDHEVERLTQEQLKTGGWGREFSGWQRVVPLDEMREIAKELKWEADDLPTYKVRVEYINKWKMQKILDTLTGEQFAQFCRDHSLSMSKWLSEGK
jgi:hypothetical protein